MRLGGIPAILGGAADSWRGHLWEGKGSHCERSACVNIQVNEAHRA